MSGQGLAQRVDQNAAARREQPSAETQVREAIKARLPTIKALLPDVLDERKLAALVITQVHQTPALARCSEVSLIGCVLRAAALGLQFGQDLGEAFLIPRGSDCTLQLGYKGVAKLARRSGEVASIQTRSVYAGDHFEYEYGLHERLVHRPAGDVPDDRGGDQGPLTHAYAIVRYVNGGHDWEVLDRRQCLARKARGKGAQPAWSSDFAKMCEKSALLAMRGRLPLSTEVATAFAQDGAAITVSSRGPAALEARHEEAAALQAPPEPETGEVRREDPPGPSPTTPPDPPADDQATDPEAEPLHHSEAIGSAAGQVVHRTLAGLKVPEALHAAVILRASGGATWHTSELLGRKVNVVTNFAEDCMADPAGFVKATLAALEDTSSPEAQALAEWLATVEAPPDLSSVDWWKAAAKAKGLTQGAVVKVATQVAADLKAPEVVNLAALASLPEVAAETWRRVNDGG